MTLPEPNTLGQYRLTSGEWVLPSPSFPGKFWIMRPNGKPVEYGLYHDSAEEALKFVNKMHEPK